MVGAVTFLWPGDHGRHSDGWLWVGQFEGGVPLFILLDLNCVLQLQFVVIYFALQSLVLVLVFQGAVFQLSDVLLVTARMRVTSLLLVLKDKGAAAGCQRSARSLVVGFSSEIVPFNCLDFAVLRIDEERVALLDLLDLCGVAQQLLLLLKPGFQSTFLVVALGELKPELLQLTTLGLQLVVKQRLLLNQNDVFVLVGLQLVAEFINLNFVPL